MVSYLVIVATCGHSLPQLVVLLVASLLALPLIQNLGYYLKEFYQTRESRAERTHMADYISLFKPFKLLKPPTTHNQFTLLPPK